MNFMDLIEKNAAFFNNIVIGLDHRCNICMWSFEAEHIFGFPKDAAQGQPVQKILGKDIKVLIDSGEPEAENNKRKEIQGHEITMLCRGKREINVLAAVICLDEKVPQYLILIRGVHSLEPLTGIDSGGTAADLLKETMQIAGLGHWVKKKDTERIQWSDEAFRIIGYNPLEVIPTSDILAHTIHPEDLDSVKDIFAQSTRDKTPFHMKYRMVRKDGSIRYIDARGKHFYDDDKELVRSLGTIQDITDQILYERDLKTLSQRLRMATQGAGIGIWDYYANNKTMVWEGAMFELYAIERKKFTGTLGQWLSAIYHEDRGPVANLIEQILSGSPRMETVFRTTGNDGTFKYIKTRAEAFFNKFGKLAHIIGVDQDVTQAVQAEQDLIRLNEKLEKRVNDRTRELEKSNKAALSIMQDLHRSRLASEEALEKLKESQVAQEKLSRAVEASPVSVVIIDPDGIFEYVNQKFCQVTGYSRKEILGKSQNILRSGKHSDSFYKEVWKLLDNGHEWHGVLCSKKKRRHLFLGTKQLFPDF